MNYLLFISCMLAINFSLLTMENPINSKAKKPGVFLEKIVSEYENPVVVKLMQLTHHYSGDCWVDEESSSSSATVLAAAWKEKTAIYVPQVATTLKCTKVNSDPNATIREIAVLRVEDVVTKAKADIWIRKYLKHHESRDNYNRGCVYVNGRTIESFNFDHDQLSHTSIDIKIPKNALMVIRNIEVTSKTASLEKKYSIDQNDWILP